MENLLIPTIGLILGLPTLAALVLNGSRKELAQLRWRNEQLHRLAYQQLQARKHAEHEAAEQAQIARRACEALGQMFGGTPLADDERPTAQFVRRGPPSPPVAITPVLVASLQPTLVPMKHRVVALKDGANG